MTELERMNLIEPMTPVARLNNRKSNYIASKFCQSPDTHNRGHSRFIFPEAKLDIGLIKIKKVPTGLRNIYAKDDSELFSPEVETAQSQRENCPKSILKNKNKIHHVNSMRNLQQREFNINSGYRKSVSFTNEAPEVVTIKLEENKKHQPLPNIEEKAIAKCQCFIY